MQHHLDPTKRHDAVIVFDATDANPNGDPDGANEPRTDVETGHGIVTDVAIKRRIRDTVETLREDTPPFGIFVQCGHALNTRTEESANGLTDPEAIARLRERYFDVRMFGQVFTRGGKRPALTARGPVQVTFARSVDSVLPHNHAITRVTQTRREDIDAGKPTTIGEKWTVAYGLYVAKLYYSAPLGIKAGVTSDDLAMLWESIARMWEFGRSATKAGVDMKAIHIFSHADKFGTAGGSRLAQAVRYALNDDGLPAREYTHYRQTLPRVPDGITITSPLDCWSDQ